MVKNIKYTIIHVNDRAKGNMEKNKKILADLEYVSEISFCNGNTEDAEKILKNMGIDTTTWSPYDNRELPIFPGEYGAWVSNINVWNFMVENDVQEMLVLEDDAILFNFAAHSLNSFVSELPEEWDFLSLFYLEGQNAFSKQTSIQKRHIHKNLNQPASAVAMLYSNSGARKLLELVKEKGIEYAHDCFIHEQGRLGLLNGYSLIPGRLRFASHLIESLGSTIDPDKKRDVPLA